LLVVSPFARGGHVFSEVSDHTSQLRFLEARFGVPVPNLSAWRRGVTSDLTRSLQSTPQLSLPPLPATSLDPRVVRTECTADQLVELEPKTSPNLLPATQAMPTQEA
jgi:phospholipase C